MKVAAIGDIHGTTKFQDCYDQINNSDKDIDKIIEALITEDQNRKLREA